MKQWISDGSLFLPLNVQPPTPPPPRLIYSYLLYKKHNFGCVIQKRKHSTDV